MLMTYQYRNFLYGRNSRGNQIGITLLPPDEATEREEVYELCAEVARTGRLPVEMLDTK